MPPTSSKLPFWASILALVLALVSLCAGWFVPYASLLCPLIAIVLAVFGLKSQRKAVSIVALVLSSLSFCILAGVGWFFWSSPEYGTGMSELGKALESLFQTILQLIKTILRIP
jgi:hypothetical protein